MISRLRSNASRFWSVVVWLRQNTLTIGFVLVVLYYVSMSTLTKDFKLFP